MLLILYSRYSIKTMSTATVTYIPLYAISSLLLDVSAIVLNGLIAYVLKKHKKTEIMTFWFIYCLSISDIFVGVSGIICESMWLIWSLGFRNSSSWWLMHAYLWQLQHYFFQTSLQLIIIIAADRYIHMKYLKKYRGIMTRSRARFIMLFSIVFGIVVIIPFSVLSTKCSALYSLIINTIRATCGPLAGILYLKTYFAIRRNFTALQVGKGGCIAPFHNLESVYQCQNVQHCRDFLKENLCEAHDSSTRSSNSQSCALAEGAASAPPDDNVFVLPHDSSTSPAKTTTYEGIQNYAMAIESVPGFVEGKSCDRSAQLHAETHEMMELRKASKSKSQIVQVNQKLSSRESAPEQTVRRAAMLIFLALFICYMPIFILQVYNFATNNLSSILEFISYTCVLLNSSLNAVLLIAFNKEMKRNVKTIFFSR